MDPQEISLLVRVTDQHGAYYEQTFLVSVLNVVEDFDGDGEEDYFDPDDDNDGFDDTLEHTLGFNPFDRWDYPQAPIVRTLEVSNKMARSFSEPRFCPPEDWLAWMSGINPR